MRWSYLLALALGVRAGNWREGRRGRKRGVVDDGPAEHDAAAALAADS